MKGLAKFLVETILGKAEELDKLFDIQSGRFSHLDEMGLPGGAGVGLSLPGGYINGAPNPKDVKKLKSKLDKDGSDEYEKVEEKINSKTHKPDGRIDHNFLHHHKLSMNAPDMGHHAEKDTIDFDDTEKHGPGHQTHKNDNEDRGYEPVKEDKIPGGLAQGKNLIDLAKKWDSKGYYDPKQFAKEYIKPKLLKGIKIEMEHTTDVRIATEIAMDHLWEDINYYEKLASIEKLGEATANGAFYNDGNATTGTMWNGTWEDYDNESYYLDGLEGWNTYHETPSEFEKKRAVDQKLPIDNQTDGKTHKYNRILKTGLKNPADFLKGDKKLKEVSSLDHQVGFNVPGMFGGEDVDITSDENLDLNNLQGWESYDKSINKFKKKAITEGLLLEGGAAGHLAHPFEDADLKFSDMKEMINRGLIGGLDKEGPVSEKLDGQNIAFSVKNGKIVFARNKGHVKNSGENALDVDGITKQFAGRGGIEKAFSGAAEDLHTAVTKLGDKEVKQMFGNGSKFMSLEIILPDTTNVIPYDKSVLIMHNTIQYDKEGNEVGRSTDDANKFASAVQKVGASQQKTFGIEGPKTITFSDADSKEFEKKAKEYSEQLSKLQKQYGLSDKSKLEDYRKKWWENKIDSEVKSTGIKLSNSEKKGLIKRWADGDKSFGVKNFGNDESKKWFKNFEDNKLVSAQKQMIKPVENVFLNVGAQTLKRVTNFLASNNPGAGDKLKKETLTAIKAIKDSKDTDKIAKLQIELERLNSIGMDKIVPSEGIVFQYGGKPYKFTGAFAPINQINGTFKFDKPKKEEKSTKKPIAIFSGRFQPFHQGHYSIYKHLVDRFGKENVYIGTSNVTEPTKSPFSFNEKKSIITKMFGIPFNKVVQVKNPYAPEEILNKMPEDTQYVTAVSQKDAERLDKGGKYFKNFDKTNDKTRKGYKDEGYYIVAPEMQLTVNGKNISGTQLRATFGSDKLTPKEKLQIFKQVYPKFDKEIFQKIVSTTKKSEKAKAQKEKTPSVKGKEMPVKNKKAVQKALDTKIKNPETGRQIKVKSALRYDDKSPVKKAAINLIKKAGK